MLANVTGISIPTLTKWTCRLKLTGTAHAGSLVPPKGCVGSGRKLTEVNNPEIEPALQQMLLEEIAGDPMGRQTWVRSSLRNLSKRLGDQGHQACTHTVARLLRKMGYSLQVAKKKQAGAQHPDRDEQFKYIAALKAQFLGENLPVISIDTKKKELIGNYRREGKTWRRQPLEVDGAGSPLRSSPILRVMPNALRSRLEFMISLKTSDTSPSEYRTTQPSSRSTV